MKKKYTTSHDLQQAYYRHEITGGEYLELMKGVIEAFSPGKHSADEKEVKASQAFADMVRTWGKRAEHE